MRYIANRENARTFKNSEYRSNECATATRYDEENVKYAVRDRDDNCVCLQYSNCLHTSVEIISAM